MMKTLRYTGGPGVDVRKIQKKDWTALDISNDEVVWDQSNDYTAELSDEAADWLLEHDPEFKEVNTDSPKKSTAAKSEPPYEGPEGSQQQP